MDSDSNLPQQPDNRQQPPPPRSFKPLIWKVVFVLLLTVNVIFVSLAGYLIGHRGHTADLSGLVVMFLALPVAFIDFIALLSYIITQRPQGRVKNIWETVLIAVSFVLTFFASIDTLSLLHIDFYFFPFRSVHASIVIAVVVTLLIVRFLRQKLYR